MSWAWLRTRSWRLGRNAWFGVRMQSGNTQHNASNPLDHQTWSPSTAASNNSEGWGTRDASGTTDFGTLTTASRVKRAIHVIKKGLTKQTLQEPEMVTCHAPAACSMCLSTSRAASDPGPTRLSPVRSRRAERRRIASWQVRRTEASSCRHGWTLEVERTHAGRSDTRRHMGPACVMCSCRPSCRCWNSCSSEACCRVDALAICAWRS